MYIVEVRDHTGKRCLYYTVIGCELEVVTGAEQLFLAFTDPIVAICVRVIDFGGEVLVEFQTARYNLFENVKERRN